MVRTQFTIRKDSRSIVLLAIFIAMVLAIEIMPIPFLTDIPLFGGFTLDPTGIPIVIVFLGLGNIFAFILIPIMFLAIAWHGNALGGVFKVFAEFYTIFGLMIARFILRNRDEDWRVAIPVYVAFGVIFRAVGMFISNIYLIQFLYGLPADAAIVLSATFVVPNIIQALINISIGSVIYVAIPKSIAIQAGLGKYYDTLYKMTGKGKILELEDDEIPPSTESENEDIQ